MDHDLNQSGISGGADRRFTEPIEVRAWDAPVVHALDLIEALPGFGPDRVEWDSFRFYGANSRWRMDRATILAYPITGAAPSTSGLRFVRFAATGGGLVVTDMAHREMTANRVARVLAVPTDSAEQAITTIGHALEVALTKYNNAHDPRSRMHQQTLVDLEPELETDVGLENDRF